jgi:hypothetical protein
MQEGCSSRATPFANNRRLSIICHPLHLLLQLLTSNPLLLLLLRKLLLQLLTFLLLLLLHSNSCSRSC